MRRRPIHRSRAWPKGLRALGRLAGIVAVKPGTTHTFHTPSSTRGAQTTSSHWPPIDMPAPGAPMIGAESPASLPDYAARAQRTRAFLKNSLRASVAPGSLHRSPDHYVRMRRWTAFRDRLRQCCRLRSQQRLSPANSRASGSEQSASRCALPRASASGRDHRRRSAHRCGGRMPAPGHNRAARVRCRAGE
jgi:hypothetical protein